MQDLRMKMDQLMLEKRMLESKNKMLVKDMLTWQSHVETLWNQEVHPLLKQLADNSDSSSFCTGLCSGSVWELCLTPQQQLLHGM